jgi:hypothetical protein
MSPKIVASACRIYAFLAAVWGPVVHPKSPYVWLVNKIKSDCWYCTTARIGALGGGVAALFFDHWLTGAVIVAGLAFIVGVERIAACAPKPLD